MKIYILSFFFTCAVGAQNLSIEDLWNQQQQLSSSKEQEALFDLGTLKIKTEKGRRLPVITGEANLQRNLIVPVTPVPSIAFDPTAQAGDITPLKFATDWSAKAGIQLAWDLFNPNTQLAIETAKLEQKGDQLQSNLDAEDLKKNATKAYGKALLAQKQYDAAVQDTILYHKIVEVSKLRFTAGRIGILEHNRAVQTQMQKQNQWVEAYQVYVNSLMELGRYHNLENVVQLSSSMEEIVAALQFGETNFKEEKIENERNKIVMQRQNLTKELLPTLTFNAYYGAQYFDNSLAVFSGDQWFGSSYVNLGLKLPISNTFQYQLKTKRFKKQEEIYSYQLEEEQKKNRIDKAQKEQKITALKQKWELSREMDKLASSSVETAQKQFDEGRILIQQLNEEVSNSWSMNKQTWQIMYDCLEAVLD
ncbi:MAG: TolC family protein [Flavobacterium sp.]|nr:TolC family protein [Candidatus Neoflavobacterium equi]